ncbi:MAG: type I-G CRISPR-associated helicase/endonuclease Cas3g [Acidimicrobiia bacterium]
MTFEEFFLQATGSPPYPWQQRLAVSGLPEVIDIETGAGKTAGVVGAWLFRLLHHPDPAVRASTPTWLAFALPMRSLVDQTAWSVQGWLSRLGEPAAVCYRLLGGEGRVESGWRERLGRPTVIVGTIDMLLSRALMRGYGSSRWVWPVEFGVLHAGTHWVFDEVQLMGPALSTSRQLEGLRQIFGTGAPCSSTWMSATLDVDRLRTIDNPAVAAPVVLDAADRSESLAQRLNATRLISERPASDVRSVADVVMAEHRTGSLTLVVVNTVKRAQEVFARLGRISGSEGPVLELLHSRYRPADRAAIAKRAVLDPVDDRGPGRVLVATQVVEAGIDISARTLVTDAAPWSSIVQRGGRCNREGIFDDARLLWLVPPRPAPYRDGDVAASIEALRQLEGGLVTSTRLRELGREVSEEQPVVPVLRRRDLVDLFDTAPDLIGNDVDVARFIRADDDTDVQVAWRLPTGTTSEEAPFAGGRVRSDELCRVAIGEARTWLKSAVAWTPDHLDPRRRWRRVDVMSVRPGSVVVVSADAGGYDPVTGWDGVAKGPVLLLDSQEDLGTEVTPIEEGTADDPATFTGTWVRLDDHLADTEMAARLLIDEVAVTGLSASHLDAVVRAAALHDVGKVHEVFQDTLVRSADDRSQAHARRLVPLAKSGGNRRVRHERPHFRHELVSALVLAAGHAELAEHTGADPDLVRYLVAAHHGRVRLAIRSMPGESPPRDRPDARVALGVADGDVVPAFTVAGTHVDPTSIVLDAMELGGGGSWTAMALGLRDRADLGPFRLATLEALVRLADWRASAAPTTVALDPGGEIGR